MKYRLHVEASNPKYFHQKIEGRLVEFEIVVARLFDFEKEAWEEHKVAYINPIDTEPYDEEKAEVVRNNYNLTLETLRHGGVRTSPIQYVAEKDGNVEIKTENSTYYFTLEELEND